jgi:hypothetical protein
MPLKLTCERCQKRVETKRTHPPEGWHNRTLCMDCHIEQVRERRDNPTAEHNRHRRTTNH